MEDINYFDEHDIREKIEKNTGGKTMSFYDKNDNTWDISIKNGEYNFKGKISNSGIPTSGSIEHYGTFVYFKNNQQFLGNFTDTIITLYRDKVNEKYHEDDEAVDYGNAFPHYTAPLEVIQEQDGESSSEKEEENVIHEEPTQQIQQHQNQSKLNLKSGQIRKSDRSNSK